MKFVNQGISFNENEHQDAEKCNISKFKKITIQEECGSFDYLLILNLTNASLHKNNPYIWIRINGAFNEVLINRSV